MNIIEQLKKNEKPFGLMSEKMQAKAREIGRNQFQHWLDEWNKCSVSPTMNQHFLSEKTYRLRPDYKEEPEVRKMTIAPNNSNCLCMYNDHEQSFGSIASVHERPDFIGFLYEAGWISPLVRAYKDKETQTRYNEIPINDINDYEVLTPTHALFKGKQ